jgi:hypothetical protein
MRKTALALVVCAASLLVPARAFAWGAAGHRLITERAIDLLPPALKPFFDAYRAEIVLRSNDPDLWRNVPWDDDGNHFVDFGIPQYGKPPFTELPREHGAALAKFGAANLKRWGTLPWRVEELFGSLRRSFEGMGRKGLYAITDVILFSSSTAHYLQDATQPFHATVNYDGLQTGNSGIHARFERDLIEKFGSKLRLSPAPPQPILNARDRAFDELVHSYGLVDEILAADKAAAGSRDTYDAEYFDKFFTSTQPLVERQLSTSISLTAGLIMGAWEQAGRPVLYTAQPRPLERVRRQPQ